jgi:hypothetical protein
MVLKSIWPYRTEVVGTLNIRIIERALLGGSVAFKVAR